MIKEPFTEQALYCEIWVNHHLKQEVLAWTMHALFKEGQPLAGSFKLPLYPIQYPREEFLFYGLPHLIDSYLYLRIGKAYACDLEPGLAGLKDYDYRIPELHLREQRIPHNNFLKTVFETEDKRLVAMWQDEEIHKFEVPERGFGESYDLLLEKQEREIERILKGSPTNQPSQQAFSQQLGAAQQVKKQISVAIQVDTQMTQLPTKGKGRKPGEDNQQDKEASGHGSNLVLDDIGEDNKQNGVKITLKRLYNYTCQDTIKYYIGLRVGNIPMTDETDQQKIGVFKKLTAQKLQTLQIANGIEIEDSLSVTMSIDDIKKKYWNNLHDCAIFIKFFKEGFHHNDHPFGWTSQNLFYGPQCKFGQGLFRNILEGNSKNMYIDFVVEKISLLYMKQKHNTQYGTAFQTSQYSHLYSNKTLGQSIPSGNQENELEYTVELLSLENYPQSKQQFSVQLAMLYDKNLLTATGAQGKSHLPRSHF